MINSNYGYSLVNNVEMFGTWGQDKNGKPKFTPKGKAIHIDEIIRNIEDNTYYMGLSFVVFQNAGKVRRRLYLDDFNRTGLLSLAKYGADVNDNNVNALINVLQNEKNTLENDFNYSPINLHKQLGWDYFEGQQIFKGYMAVSKKDQYGNPTVTSSYDGEYWIKPQGQFETWLKLIKEEVLGNTPLELAVVIGLSGVVNAYIGKTFDCDNLLIHLVGESSKGKTTAGILALSTSSVPVANFNNQETHMRTWNATKNALLQSLNGNHGFPVLFDEFSMNKDYSITDLIYSIVYGKDKSRLNSDSEQKFTKDFKTTIISTGEASMLNKTSKNTGLLVRLIEFSNIQWTESATQSEKIKRVCRENCGFAIYYIAKYLLNTPLDILEREFEEQRKLYLDSSTTKKEFADRISTKYAMLLLTAKIVSKVLKLNLNHKAILDLLVKNESSTFNDMPSNVGERAYESLLEYVSTNKNYFGNGQFAPTIGEIRGVIKPDEIVIPKDKFAKIMKELGFEDTKTIIKNWKDKNLLNCDRDRNTRKRKLTNESCEINCYVIKKDKSTELMPNFMKNMRTEPRKVDTWEEFIK